LGPQAGDGGAQFGLGLSFEEALGEAEAALELDAEQKGQRRVWRRGDKVERS
jgi:hypothetical protein